MAEKNSESQKQLPDQKEEGQGAKSEGRGAKSEGQGAKSVLLLSGYENSVYRSIRNMLLPQARKKLRLKLDELLDFKAQGSKPGMGFSETKQYL